MNLNKAFQDFENMYGLEPVKPETNRLLAAKRLIEDEVSEFEDEITAAPHLKNLAKEMTDIIYITGERMTNFGFDVDALFAEVHRSNMSKRVHIAEATFELAIAKQRYPRAYLVQLDAVDYVVIKDAETSKVIKPTSYSAAMITPEMLGYPNPTETNIDMIEVLSNQPYEQ